MKLFKRDYTAELTRAKQDLAGAGAELTRLQEQRTAALGEAAAPVVELRKIDRATEEGRATVALLQDRIRRLSVLARQAEFERREQERDRAIKTIIEPQVAQIEKLTADVATSVEALSRSYAALEAAVKDVSTSWPAAVPKPQFWTGLFSFRDISVRFEGAFGYASRGHVGKLSEWVNSYGGRQPMVATVSRQIAASIAELKSVPIVMPDEPDDDAMAIAS